MLIRCACACWIRVEAVLADQMRLCAAGPQRHCTCRSSLLMLICRRLCFADLTHLLMPTLMHLLDADSERLCLLDSDALVEADSEALLAGPACCAC